jgi:hypothetical protein
LSVANADDRPLASNLLEWFRQQRGYQTRINAILRAYMDAQTSDHRRQAQNT